MKQDYNWALSQTGTTISFRDDDSRYNVSKVSELLRRHNAPHFWANNSATGYTLTDNNYKVQVYSAREYLEYPLTELAFHTPSHFIQFGIKRPGIDYSSVEAMDGILRVSGDSLFFKVDTIPGQTTMIDCVKITNDGFVAMIAMARKNYSLELTQSQIDNIVTFIHPGAQDGSINDSTMYQTAAQTGLIGGVGRQHIAKTNNNPDTLAVWGADWDNISFEAHTFAQCTTKVIQNEALGQHTIIGLHARFDVNGYDFYAENLRLFCNWCVSTGRPMVPYWRVLELIRGQ